VNEPVSGVPGLGGRGDRVGDRVEAVRGGRVGVGEVVDQRRGFAVALERGEVPGEVLPKASV